MNDPTYQAKIYPQGGNNPTITHADPRRADVGICFSGGGSRALTCAWGQMMGLRSLRYGSATLLDQVRYISSVSGGSWASVLYTFLPASIPDDAFLAEVFAPQDLFLHSAPASGMDLSHMGPWAMGQVPQRFANLLTTDPVDNIIADFITIVLIRRLELDDSLKWLWMYIVGSDVLAPFGLYDYRFSLFDDQTPWRFDHAKYFGLSKATKPAGPPAGEFHFVRGDGQDQPCRPMLVINTNIVAAAPSLPQPIQIPMQVTPVSGGSFGANPVDPDQIVGGGSVASFAFTSVLQSAQGNDGVKARFPRRYVLADITSVSSAFYAATLAKRVPEVLASLRQLDDSRLCELVGNKIGGIVGYLVRKLHWLVGGFVRRRLQSLQLDATAVQLSDLVPEYNNWPVAGVSAGAAANRRTQFTDGGNLENTGVLGMLAQTDAANIIAFVNTDVALEQTTEGVIVAAAQASPLFGIAFDSASRRFKAYQPGGVNPFTGSVDPTGFLQVFDNAEDAFAKLREGLYRANGSGAASGPAFFQQSLKVIDNPLAGVRARPHPVTLLWVQNARVNDWQSKIKDPALRDAIATGQREGWLTEFADFPLYSTFAKVHQTAAETNTLAQMWAWCVADADSPLSAPIKQLFEPGSGAAA
ncbi:MAG: hypothetical protein WBG92_09440 [Thiohalocapsa sp.]